MDGSTPCVQAKSKNRDASAHDGMEAIETGSENRLLAAGIRWHSGIDSWAAEAVNQ